MSAIKAKQEDLKKSGSYDSADFDKLEAGNNVRRILPPKGDKDVFWSEGYVHFGLGESGKDVVTCPTTFDKDATCPVCEYIETLKKSKNAEDKKLAENIRKTKRTYIAVINRDDDEEKVKVLPVGKTILQPIINLICDPDYGDITDVKDGIDITINKSGTGMKTEYSVTPKRKSSKAMEDLSEEEIQNLIPDLDALFVKKTIEEIQAILDGEDYDPGEDEDDDDEDEETTVKKSSSKPKKYEDEDEDESEYDDLTLDELMECCEDRGLELPPKVTRRKCIDLLVKSDEEELEAIKSKKRKSKKHVEPEEEIEEDDEDEAGTMDAIKGAISRRKK